ncbi:hypothetical protein FDG2_0974 [Candidatus Protofrankia californiensis]|uniref:Uncharacterized protein n=1 Tax=Candidatus Protofrankia californiensis TaxID=1839754 RepID=A0A1C3NUV1_9ACTN|nr:hypothetical protein FDG2_0974 [Candidatus Protofrankia californiensis]
MRTGSQLPAKKIISASERIRWNACSSASINIGFVLTDRVD